RDPLTSRVIHIDFHAISMNKPLNIDMPIKFIGTPIGVKVDGGIMQATMRELEIECLPADIPDSFEIDVSELGIGDSIHVRDLNIPNVKILAEARRTVVVISAPTVVKSDEAAAAAGEDLDEEAAGAAEGAEAAPADGDGDKKADKKADK
ncbi:MAG: 50S ribosomal protein L25, partial [candidate division Zixibacteria bacterium]|nr:50S ribosomal protein L25 [candidate division Zixibacteria bacterium]